MYTEKFFKKVFKAETIKDAYMKAAKWYATNIISKVELQRNVMVSFEKDKQFPVVTLYLYISIPEKEIRSKHCEVCHEVHSLFYINQTCNCSQCNLKGYENRIDEALKVKKQWAKETLRKSIESN